MVRDLKFVTSTIENDLSNHEIWSPAPAHALSILTAQIHAKFPPNETKLLMRLDGGIGGARLALHHG